MFVQDWRGQRLACGLKKRFLEKSVTCFCGRFRVNEQAGTNPYKK